MLPEFQSAQFRMFWNQPQKVTVGSIFQLDLFANDVPFQVTDHFTCQPRLHVQIQMLLRKADTQPGDNFRLCRGEEGFTSLPCPWFHYIVRGEVLQEGRSILTCQSDLAERRKIERRMLDVLKR